MKWSNLVIDVVDIAGVCPVYKVGDQFRLREGYRIETQGCCDICMHSMGSIIPWAVALSGGVRPADCGLAHEGEQVAHVRCLDPGPPLTPGGTVTFAIRIEPS